VSFFDDEDPPTRTSRTAQRPRRRTAPAGAPRPGDRQQLLIRRAVALGVAVLVLILIVIGVNSCRSNAHKNSLRDYNSNVSALVQQSDQQVSKPLFSLLTGGNKSPVTLETQINQYRVVAEDQAQRARNLDVPGEMAGAQRALLMTLDFRAEGVGAIADKIRAALGSAAAAAQATSQIAGQMQKFLASDVIYSQRTAPLIKQALDDAGVTGQTIATSKFLPGLGWLDPNTVAERLGSSVGPSGEPTTPGPHGHGLTSTSVGSTTLQPGGAVNRIPATADLAFTVAFENQGAADESDVNVKVQITGAGKPITVSKTIPQTKAGQTVEAEIPLGQAPPIGTPVDIVVTIGKVPGEVTTSNNTATYTAIFTR
jgi:hypothetical protein